MSLDQGLFVPAILGILEGLTEFLPVSSTAHLLLAAHFLGFNSPGDVFEVLIQLGAILAIVIAYFGRIVLIIRDALSGKPGAWRFILGVILAALPAAVAGALLHDFIKGDIYSNLILICSMLIIGGIILLYVDQMKFVPKYTTTMARMAPSWISTSNTSPGLLKPRKCAASSKWAVEETGRNSVRPSKMPKIAGTKRP